MVKDEVRMALEKFKIIPKKEAPKISGERIKTKEE